LLQTGQDEKHQPAFTQLIDPVADKPLQTIPWADPQVVGINSHETVALTADGKTLLVVHREKPKDYESPGNSTVLAFDVATGRRLSRFVAAGNYSYSRPPISPCGRWVVLRGKVYHVGIGTELFTPSGEPGESLHPGNRMGSPVWFSEDGRLLAGLLSRQPGKEPATPAALAVWELASGKVLARFPKGRLIGQVAFAPDGRTVALLDGRGVLIQDLLTGKPLAEYQAPDVTCQVNHSGGPQTLVFAPDGRTLATGHQDGSILLWQVPQPADDPKPITQTERESLWADLGSDSPTKARAAVEWLARSPDTAVALLTARFRPAATPADAALAALLKDLDSDLFARREEADRKLREHGAKAEPALRRVLAGNPPLEMKRRIERILEAIPPPVLRLPLTGETLRGVRAIEVLERSGTHEARQHLRAWAEQTRDLRLTVEARTALERTSRRNSIKDSSER